MTSCFQFSVVSVRFQRASSHFSLVFVSFSVSFSVLIIIFHYFTESICQRQDIGKETGIIKTHESSSLSVVDIQSLSKHVHLRFINTNYSLDCDQRLPSPIFTRQAIVSVTFSKELPLWPFRTEALFLVVGEM